jgi:hypothetical protein
VRGMAAAHGIDLATRVLVRVESGDGPNPTNTSLMLGYACCFYPLFIFKSTPTSNGEGMGRK